jgi:hypothetical protein
MRGARKAAERVKKRKDLLGGFAFAAPSGGMEPRAGVS